MFNASLTPNRPRPPKTVYPPLGDAEPPIFITGFFGTLIAGGLFPGPMFFIQSALGGSRVTPDDLAFLVAAFPIGIVFAGVAAVVAFPTALVIRRVCGSRDSRVLMASIAGGWSGVIATIGFSNERDFVTGLYLQLAAMLMGQFGSGFLAQVLERWMIANRGYVKPRDRIKLTLRQLFAITTCVAVLAAAIASLPLPSRGHEKIAICIVAQAALIAGYVAVRRVFRRRESAADFGASSDFASASALDSRST